MKAEPSLTLVAVSREGLAFSTDAGLYSGGTPLVAGRFSTLTGCPQASVSFYPIMRALKSVGPAGVNGTTMRSAHTG